MKNIENKNVSKNNLVNQISFGKKIREAREKNNLTRANLAEILGISVNFLGDIERGIKLPSVPTLILISNSLKVSLDSLFSESLDNMVYEENENIYYTTRQKIIINNLIKTINENFKD